MKLKIIALLYIVLLIGCGVGISGGNGGGSGGNNGNSKTSSVSVKTSLNCVSVYTLGNVVNAVVTDKSGKIAKYDVNTSKYCFNDKINYPIKVQVLPDTFIDVDYDNNKTANDIKPKFKELKSYYNYVDLVTSMHGKAVDDNLSKEKTAILSKVSSYYENQIDDKYDVNLTNPVINEKILNFIIYDDYINKNKLPSINDDLFDSYNNLKLFFDNGLTNPYVINKVKYYSFYHSLELLDKKLITRADTIHKPNITYLHLSGLPIMKKIEVNYTNVIVKDIKEDNYIYTASGIDGVVKFDNTFKLKDNIKVNSTFSTSYNLDIFKFDKKSYLFVADGGEGISIIDITGGIFKNLNVIMWKYYDEDKDKNISITIDDTKGLKLVDDVISVKTYVSPLGNKMWLAFGTKGNGLYLVDLNKTLSKIKIPSSPLIIYDPKNDENNTLWITGDGDTVYSEAFSSDGENLYATKKNTIERYDLSSLVSLSKPTPKNFNIKANYAYNLVMITKSGIDELFISTDKGVEVYDVLNNGDLNFISKYTTEGAQEGYWPKMVYVIDKDILLITDGYKGIKAIKYDSSYNPKLCGVGYFSSSDNNTTAARVTSVTFDKNSTDVIVGVEGYGLLKFKLNDLLFKHCQ